MLLKISLPSSIAFSLLALLLSWIGPVHAQRRSQPSTPASDVAHQPQGSVVYRQQLNAAPATSATLVFTGQQALYYHGRKPLGRASREITKTEGDQTRYTLDIEDNEGQCVYTDQAGRQLLSRTYEFSIGGNVLLEEPLPAFEWVIGSATKTLGTYRVQQASTTFRGRQYEVWFAPDIPLPWGPWKLGGLPGLILEAYDTKKLFVFEATAIDLPARVPTPVVPPTEGQRVQGWQTYQSLAKNGRARLVKFVQAGTPGVTLKLNSALSLEVIE